MERCCPGRRRRLDVRVPVEERADDLRVTAFGGEVKWRVSAEARHRRGLRAVLEQQPRELGVAGVGGPMQRRHAVALAAVDVSAVSEQRGDGGRIAAHGSVGDAHITGGGGWWRGAAERQRAGQGEHREATCVQHCSTRISIARRPPYAVNEKVPVESPNCWMSVSPSLCISVSMTFAIGVPAAALRCVLPASCPLAPPSTISGQRLWLCTLLSPIGEP